MKLAAIFSYVLFILLLRTLRHLTFSSYIDHPQNHHEKHQMKIKRHEF